METALPDEVLLPVLGSMSTSGEGAPASHIAAPPHGSGAGAVVVLVLLRAAATLRARAAVVVQAAWRGHAARMLAVRLLARQACRGYLRVASTVRRLDRPLARGQDAELKAEQRRLRCISRTFTARLAARGHERLPSLGDMAKRAPPDAFPAHTVGGAERWRRRRRAVTTPLVTDEGSEETARLLSSLQATLAINASAPMAAPSAVTRSTFSSQAHASSPKRSPALLPRLQRSGEAGAARTAEVRKAVESSGFTTGGRASDVAKKAPMAKSSSCPALVTPVSPKPSLGSSVCPFVEISGRGMKSLVDACAAGDDDCVYDIGCGKGNVIEEILSRYPCRGVAVDFNPSLLRTARKRLERFGNRIDIRCGDVRQMDLGDATIVVTFFITPAADKVKRHFASHLPTGCTWLNYAWPVPGWRTEGPPTNSVFRYVIGQHLESPKATVGSRL